jgi:hypothetical protein
MTATLACLPGELIDDIIDYVLLALPTAGFAANPTIDLLDHEDKYLSYCMENFEKFANKPPPSIPRFNANSLLMVNHYLKTRTEAALARNMAQHPDTSIIDILCDEKAEHLGISFTIANPEAKIMQYNIRLARFDMLQYISTPVTTELVSFLDFCVLQFYAGSWNMQSFPWKWSYKKVILNFVIEEEDAEEIPWDVDRLVQGEMWIKMCRDMLVSHRQTNWGPRYDGLPSWMPRLSDHWKVKNIEVQNGGKKVVDCDIGATLEAWDMERDDWAMDNVGASNVGDWEPEGPFVYTEYNV